MSYLAPNYIFNDRDNEQIGMLLVEPYPLPNPEGNIQGYQVRIMKGTDREQDRMDNRYKDDKEPNSIYLGKDKDGGRIDLRADGTLITQS